MKSENIGLIFDIDGVVLNSPHQKSWGQAVKQLYHVPFLDKQYNELASGVPREQGAKRILGWLGVNDDEASISELCNTKQSILDELIEKKDFDVYTSTVLLMYDAKQYGNRLAAASSSQNAEKLLKLCCVNNSLETSGRNPDKNSELSVYDLFDYALFGGVKPGKPDPKIFLEAAKGIEKEPKECVVFEDAIDGVKAAKAGNFYCVGIGRNGNYNQLVDAGADIVVNDLSQMMYRGMVCNIKYGGNGK